MTHAAAAARLADFCSRHPRLLVLTGAGCSTASGIPAYRNEQGEWQHPAPVQYQDFVRSARVRQRYWARSAVGWSRIRRAMPSPVHGALAALENAGRIERLVTQNVDGLHQAAGSSAVVDLHGRLDQVRCLACGLRIGRAGFQSALLTANPGWQPGPANSAPDGDARLPDPDSSQFEVPGCPGCGGTLKPDVVFFGESVPRERVAQAQAALARADALLVVGSSLMVYSGYRFAREARRLGRPIAAINLGRTRADELLQLKCNSDCNAALPALVRRLRCDRLAEA